jgi:hypothetical protein
MKRVIRILFSALATLLMTSCIDNLVYIDGDGNITTERRRIGSFNEIQNTTAFDVVFTRSDTTGIRVTADRNILDNIIAETSGGVLEIRTEPEYASFRYTQRPLIEVSGPELESVFLSGSGNLVADRMEGDEVEVRLSGSGQVRLYSIDCSDLSVSLSGSGRISIDEAECTESDILISGSGNILLEGVCEISTVRISGSGNLYADKFRSVKAEVTISGSGDAYTLVSEELSGLISGSGNIYYSGNPLIKVRITGSGRVIRN